MSTDQAPATRAERRALADAAAPPETRVRRVALRGRPSRRMLGPVPLAVVVGLELAAVGVVLLLATTSSAARVLAGALVVGGLLWAIPLRGVPLGVVMARRAGFAARARAADVEPGTVRPARTATGAPLGVLDRPPLASAALVVRPRRQGLVRVGTVPRLPLGTVAERLAAADVPHDSVTLVHDLSRRVDPVLVVRVDPLRARDAVAVRGGGVAGVDAVLAALVSVVSSAVRFAGLEAHPLDPEELGRAVAAEVGDADARWSERWTEVITGSAVHRVLRATRLGPGFDVDRMGVRPPGAARLVVRVRAESPGRVHVRVLVAVTDRGAGGLSRATRELTRAASPLRLHALGGRHREALAEAGGGLGGDGPLEPLGGGWVSIPPTALEVVSPTGAQGPGLGVLLDGSPVRLAPEGGGRLVVLGDGRLTTSVVVALVASGVAVTVVADRAAPWGALARDLPEGALEVVSPDDPVAARDGVVVLDGARAVTGPNGRTRSRGRAFVVAAPDSAALPAVLLRGADAVVVGRGAGLGADLPGGVSAEVVRAGLVGSEVVLVDGGGVRPLRLGVPD